MTDREKLVELIRSTHNDKNLGWYDLYDLTHETSGCAEYFADYLLSNGVAFAENATVESKWIPASEPPKEDGEYIVMIKGDASATALLYDEEGWFWMHGDERVGYHVTHWMPLPEPPKEG